MVEEGSGGPERRWWALWAGIGIVLTVLAFGVPNLLVAALAEHLPGLIHRANAGVGRPGRPPANPMQAAFLRQVSPLLDRQAAALLRGDEPGFLALADPAAPVRTELKRQFRSLRAMKVTVWRPRLDANPVRSGDGWRLPVTVEYCFVEPGCRPSPVTVGTRWAEGTSPRLVAVEPSHARGEGPHPWEVSALVAVVGERTLVATTANFRGRLPQLLVKAERAAAVADRYTVGGAPPERYLIFYAGGAEWKRWYGGGHADWIAGYAVAVGGGHYDLVLNSADLHRNAVDDLLRHELAHAASLPADGYANSKMWWLVEGIAEYAAAGGRPLSRYENLADVRRLIREGRWDGRLDATEPPGSAADWEVGARYGIGYLAVRHLVERFGEPALLDFFGQVVHDGRPLAEASRHAFGEDWSGVDEECVSYVRSAAG